MLLPPYWAKQIYWSAAVIYPTVHLCINAYRHPGPFARFYLKRADYAISDADVRLFEEELIKLSERQDEPLENVKFMISTSNKVSEKVYGIYMLRYGPDFEFPARMLLRTADEFREHVGEIVKGASGSIVGPEITKHLPKSEIENILLSESARRFLFQRSLMTANAYGLFVFPVVLWAGCVAACYAVFYVCLRTVGPIMALISGLFAATALYFYVNRAYKKTRDLQLDRKVYEIGPEYAVGCADFLRASINFGKLMNRLSSKDRGHPRPLMFVTPFLRQARRAGGSKGFRSAADEWIKSAWGRRARIGVLAASTVAYPIGILLWNGPLVGFVFKRRWSVEEVPPHLERLIKEEFDAWREREGRDEKDAHVKFFVQRQFDDIDSIRAGSMGVRFGARIALAKYCESKLEPLYVLKRPIGMVWDSTYAKELLKTFVLSENALRFLIQRDLMSQDGYQAFANKAISWASFNTFASLLIYWIHLRRPNPTALSFVVIYTIFMTLGILGGNEWHKLYKYMTDMHADSTAARLSADYCAGGIEYYMKLLKRNQLLRALLDDGSRLFTPAGDKLRTDTSYVLRFSLLKDATHEFSELAPVVEGDVF
ncbi:hypothetical protein M3Y99_00499000 [Aphelenchoides fujianensis]|nr:hypothetical protein M3Y99_00499000 [Aphelenchoides fujianensis]